MSRVGKCHGDRLERSLPKLEEKHTGRGHSRCKDKQGFFANHTQHCGPKEKGVGTQVEVGEADRDHRSKDLGAGPKRSLGHNRIQTRDRTQLTSGLPRLWPPVCQLGAMFRAQHTQPRGRSVHQ